LLSPFLSRGSGVCRPLFAAPTLRANTRFERADESERKGGDGAGRGGRGAGGIDWDESEERAHTVTL
jgi:hypothetical protein